MSTPDDRPTAVQPTAVQPEVSTAPPTRRAALWRHRLPARIGRARTSTLVIGCLFLLLYALHVAVQPDPVEYTTVTDANTGAVLTVPASLVPPAPSSPAAPTSSTEAPETSSAASTRTPATTSGTPRSTTPAPRSTTDAPTTTAPRTSSSAPTDDETTPASTSDEPAPSTADATTAAPSS